jgi:hypothetical protein
MRQDYWILVVERCESDRKLIELAGLAVSPGVEMVFVAGYDEFVSAIAERRNLPAMAILDWFAGGGGADSCLDTLSRLGFLSRMPLVATSRENPMLALDESYELGVGRFISKLPDDFSFKKKIAEAISGCVPGAKKVGPPSSAVA